jgi:hypothetical protein
MKLESFNMAIVTRTSAACPQNVLVGIKYAVPKSPFHKAMSLNQEHIVARLQAFHLSQYKILIEKANCIIWPIPNGVISKTIFPLSLCQCKKNVRYRCYAIPLAGKRGAIWSAAARWKYTGGENRGKPPCGSSSMAVLLNLKRPMKNSSRRSMGFTAW